MSKGEPIKTVNYPFLVFSPNHLFLPEVVEVVITWEWEEYGKKFELVKSPIFEKHILTPGESKNPKTYAHFYGEKFLWLGVPQQTALTPEINFSQYAIEIKCLTLKD